MTERAIRRSATVVLACLAACLLLMVCAGLARAQEVTATETDTPTPTASATGTATATPTPVTGTPTATVPVTPRGYWRAAIQTPRWALPRITPRWGGAVQ